MTKSLAIVFPGQGSQALGMLGALGADWPLVKETFAEASAVLGTDLWQLASAGPRELLDRTDLTQPVMLTAGVSVWRVWNQAGGSQPSWLAGHSLGEFTALVCAEVLAFADAVALVAQRGRFMQEAVPAGEGAMAAILGLADDLVTAACAKAAEGQVLAPVNFNCPGQVVIAGHAEAVARGMVAAKAAGAKRTQLLPVSVPSHCDLMRPAARRLEEALARITLNRPRIPILHNVSVDTAMDPEAIRERLVQQLYSPVLWVETIRKLADEGVNLLIEAGPGKVLTGLTKRIDDRLEALAVLDPGTLAAALEATS